MKETGCRRLFEATKAELLSVQPEVFKCLYNADQTPIQAEMPVENTLETRNANKVSIAPGGEHVFGGWYKAIL